MGIAVAPQRRMSERDVARRLFDYLDEHAFRPVLEAEAEHYPAAQREALALAQRETRREREQLLHAASAAVVYRAFHAQIASPEATARYARLRELDLPTLEDLRIDFEQMAADLGLGSVGTT